MENATKDRMTALRKLEPGHGLTLEQVRVPRPTAGTALIKVHRAAVCGTDVHLLHDRFANSPPFTLGHEFSGTVEALGPGTRGVEVGDRVVSENNPFACGECRVCKKGFPNLCPHKKAMGIHSDGAFAPYLILPADLLHVIPEGISMDAAALMEPTAVAAHAVSPPCGIEEGDVVVVLGPGAIGLLCGEIALALGAARVLIAGTAQDAELRFPLAKRLGLEPISVETEDLLARVAEVTDGLGADVVVEASGSPRAVAMLESLARRAGRVSVVGITGRDAIEVAWDRWIGKGLTCHFSYGSLRQDWELGLRLLQEGKIDTESLITHRYPLKDWPLALAATEKQTSIRSIFQIGDEE
jgi:L-iditol 2-dehydrogenase